MTTLHFNTDMGRMTISTIAQCKINIESELNIVRSRVNALVGTEWISNSATAFQSEFDSFANGLIKYLQSLEALQQRLEQEVEEWESAAQSLA